MLEKIYFANNGTEFTYKWEDETFYFYIFMLLIILLCDPFIKSIKGKRFLYKKQINNTVFFSLFLLFFLVCALRGDSVGRDTPMYNDIFYASINWNSLSRWGMEPGFYCLNSLFRRIFTSREWGIVIFSFITLFLIFKTIYDNRNRLDVTMALFLFVGIGFYLQSFDLLRISLCTSIELYYFHYIIEKKYYKYFIVLLLCVTIHYTAMLMIVPYLSYILFRKKMKYYYFYITFLTFVSSYIASNLGNFIFIARYEHYTSDEMSKVGLGMAQFVYNLPILAFAYYMSTKKYISRNMIVLLVIYSCFCMLYGILGYYIPVGRSVIHFLMIFVILIPYCLYQLKRNNDKYYYYIRFFLILYGVLRYHMYLKDYLYSDGIMPYKMMEFQFF